MTEPGVRHFTADTLGGLCEGCQQPIPAALAGDTRHPTCDLDWPALKIASERAIRLAGFTMPPESPLPAHLEHRRQVGYAARAYGTATSDPLGREGPGWKRGKNGLPVRIKEGD